MLDFPRHKKANDCLTTRPKHIAIVALGSSYLAFTVAMSRGANAPYFPNEVWGINTAANWLRCDKLFLMDGFDWLEKQMPHMAPWIDWMAHYYDKPIIMPRVERQCKMSVAYPIEEVVTKFGRKYFKNTVAYAIAYALYIGVEQIDLFGADFVTYSPRPNRDTDKLTAADIREYEDGRANCEFWCGVAHAMGVKVRSTAASQFLGSDDDSLYGYGDKQPVFTSLITTNATVDGIVA